MICIGWSDLRKNPLGAPISNLDTTFNTLFEAINIRFRGIVYK